MVRKLSKVLCLVVAVMLLTSIFSSCKRSDKAAQTATKSSSTKATATSKKTTSAKSTGTTATTNKTASSTSRTGTTAAGNTEAGSPVTDAGQPSDDNQPGESNNEYTGEKIGSTPLSEQRIDLKGRKFVIADRGLAPDPQSSDPVARLWANSLKAGETKYNMQVEWKTVAGGTGVIASEFVNTTMAGMLFSDVIALGTKQCFPSMAENKLIAPIDDYVDFNSPLYNTDYIKTVGLWKDKQYGFTRPVYAASTAVFYNRDIFEGQDLPDLQNLREEGRWDWDTFLQIGQQATKDLNGDGVVDQWGIEYHGGDYAGVAFLNSNGMEYFQYIDSKVQFMLNDNRAVKALQFMSDLVNTYKVATPNIKAFNNGAAAMVIGNLLASVKDYAGIRAGVVMVPKGPDVDAPQTFNNGGNIWAFPTNANLNEDVPVFMDMLTIWDPSKPEHVTYEDYNYNYLVGKGYTDERDINFAMKYCAAPKISMYNSMPDLQKLIQNEVLNKIIQQETTPAAALDAVTASAQGIIDSVIDTQ